MKLSAGSKEKGKDMGRRKDLQGLCNDLLGSFVSRNNNLDGYWALGKLQRALEEPAEDRLLFDLKPGGRVPISFQQLNRDWQANLAAQCRRRGLPLDWIAKAELAARRVSSMQLECTLTIVTDLDRVFVAQQKVFVRPHDPEREYRRAL
ncbi:hypothetical protein [Tritonibacter multivorans]|uniref:hypothetical protein n=1 Tax=Tritonibacter multivorans TaxID=928856 RepID=UPI0010427E18|nr:hypothetical protein [Tritonibacter multivorans]MDA7419596.1 hypothetical protein [Tritonibacter multivorans]